MQAANAKTNGNRKNKLTGERIKIFSVSYDMIYLSEIGLTAGGSSSVNIYIQTVNRTTQ
jgi:hypothetical protein